MCSDFDWSLKVIGKGKYCSRLYVKKNNLKL